MPSKPGSEELSRFGQLLMEMADRRGMSRYELAKAVGCSYSVLVESLRANPNGGSKRAYKPTPERVEKLAQALGLTGEEAKRFIRSGHIERSTALVQDYIQSLERRVAELEKKVNRRG